MLCVCVWYIYIYIYIYMSVCACVLVCLCEVSGGGMDSPDLRLPYTRDEWDSDEDEDVAQAPTTASALLSAASGMHSIFLSLLKRRIRAWDSHFFQQDTPVIFFCRGTSKYSPTATPTCAETQPASCSPIVIEVFLIYCVNWCLFKFDDSRVTLFCMNSIQWQQTKQSQQHQ